MTYSSTTFSWMYFSEAWHISSAFVICRLRMPFWIARCFWPSLWRMDTMLIRGKSGRSCGSSIGRYRHCHPVSAFAVPCWFFPFLVLRFAFRMRRECFCRCRLGTWVIYPIFLNILCNAPVWRWHPLFHLACLSKFWTDIAPTIL